MSQNVKQILANDKSFVHNGIEISYGWRGSKEDNDLSIVGGAKLSATTFDAQIWFNFGADGFGDGSEAAILAASALPNKLFNQKLVELYGPFGAAPAPDLFDLLLEKVQLLYKSRSYYDSSVGLVIK